MATTYYVDGAVGNDSNSGLSEGAGNALATINAGLAKQLYAQSDTVMVKASVTYAEAVAFSVAGQASNPTTLEGYTTTPGDGGQVSIDASGNTYGIRCDKSYLSIRNFIVDGATSVGVWANYFDYLGCHNVISQNNGGDGFYADDYCSFHNCQALGNGGVGIDAGRYSSLYNCVMAFNDDWGYDGSDNVGNLLYNCIFTGNHDASTRYEARCSYGTNFVNCTFDGRYDTGTHYGIYGTSGPHNILNCVFINCDKAIYISNYKSASGGGANAFYNNVTDITTWDPDWNPEGNITADPKFTDAPNEDYTLASDSPLLKAGRGGVDIGAEQYDWTEGGGGGGRVVLTS